MANRIRSFFESLVYAGLKPSGGVPAGASRPRRLGALRDRIDRFISGGLAPSDPFYLTNRTWKQKSRLYLAIGIPATLLLAGLALVFTNVFTPKAAPPKEVPAAEILAKLLPNLEKTVHIETYKDAEIVELRVARDGPPRIVGVLKNKTNRVISVELQLDLADEYGSQVGSATERVNGAPANSTVPFDFPVESPEAANVLVRKLRTVL